MTPRCLRDPILLSIDVGVGPSGHLETIGIATLDTRFIADSPTPDTVKPRLLLTRRRTLPLNSRTRQYLFGKPEYSPPAAAREVLRGLTQQLDEGHGGLRNVLLVGHHIDNDIRYLKEALEFDILSAPSIVAVIDTQQVARRVFSFPHKWHLFKIDTIGPWYQSQTASQQR